MQSIVSSKKNFFILIFFDALFIALSWGLTYLMRFVIFHGESGLFLQFVYITPLIIAIELYFFSKAQLYKFQIFKAWHINITSIVTALTQGFFTVVVIFYFFFPGKISRLGLGFYYFLSILITIFERIVITNILQYQQARKGKPSRIFLIGYGKNITDYIERNFDTESQREKVNFIGWYEPGKDNKYNITEIGDDFLTEIKRLQPDLMIIGYPPEKNNRLNYMLSQCYDLFLPIIVIPNLSYSFLNTHIEDFKGVPTLYLNHFHNLY